MTAPLEEAAEPARAPDPATEARVATPAIGDICPYLLASNRGWRSAAPNRDHRCTAVDPPAPLPADKQRELCLTAGHSDCPAFRAARTARATMLAPGLDPAIVAAADAARRPVARGAAVILEQPRLSIGRGVGTGNWALSQAALVALMVLAFAVLLFARLSTPGSPAASPSAVPSNSAEPTPSPTARPTPTPTPLPSGSGLTPSGSGAPAASPGASGAAFRTTYRVQSGDTLVGIAASFGTTVAAIQTMNGLSGSELRIGQLLKIP
jgi:LysM repeat protein